MIVAEAVGRTLAALGVDTVFGVVGSGNFHVTNALVAHGARYVAARHEGGAATMADAHARMTGGVGVLSVHQGPGLTNAMTGITEAAKSRTPLIVLAGEATERRSNFHIDQDGLARAVGAVPMRIASALTAVDDTIEAFRTATRRRVPVLLNLPLDVQREPVVWEAEFFDSLVRSALVAGAPLSGAGSPAALSELVLLLLEARRPVFIAGRGARHAGRELQELAEIVGALLATSAVAKGLFRGNPWDLDVSGGFATPLAASLIGSADLVVAWGCALNMWTTRHGTLLGPSAVVVQVDHEEAALGAHIPVRLGVCGDVAAVAAAVGSTVGQMNFDARLYAAATAPTDPTNPTVGGVAQGGGPLRDAPVPSDVGDAGTRGTVGDGSDGGAGMVGEGRGYRSAEVARRIAAEGRWRAVPYEDESRDGRIDPRTLTIGLDDLLPPERVIALDSGNFMGYPAMFLDVPDEYGFCFTQGFQSIGLGLATAIGAALARPDRLPVAALGDGGALMGIAELETVARLGLPMVIVIYDDEGYGAEVHHFTGDPLDTVTFPPTDFAELARGYGCAAVTVTRPSHLAGVADWVKGPRDRPLLVHAKVTREHGSWWLEEAFKGH